MDISMESEISAAYIDEYSSSRTRDMDNFSNHKSPKKNIGDVGENILSDNTKQSQCNDEDFNNLSDISVSSADTYTPKTMNITKFSMPIVFSNWEVYLIEDQLVVSGLVAGSVTTDRICKQRLSSLIFKDVEGITCSILGPMKKQNEVPEFIRNQFKYIYEIDVKGNKIYKDGIPENWRVLCTIWKRFIECEKRETFNWMDHFNGFTLIPSNEIIYYNSEDKIKKRMGRKNKIKQKFDKYKSMLQSEMIRNSFIAVSDDSDDEIHQPSKKSKNKSNDLEENTVNKVSFATENVFTRNNEFTVTISHLLPSNNDGKSDSNVPPTNNNYTPEIDQNITNGSILQVLEINMPSSENRDYEPSTFTEQQTSLNKRTTCYINNQISVNAPETNTISCQTDLTINDIGQLDHLKISESIDNNELFIDNNKTTNVTIVSPTKNFIKYVLVKDGLNKNELIENENSSTDSVKKTSKNESNKQIILKDLTNKKHPHQIDKIKLKAKRSFSPLSNNKILNSLKSNKSNSICGTSSQMSISSRGRLCFPTSCFWKPLSLTISSKDDSIADNNTIESFNCNVLANSTTVSACNTPKATRLCGQQINKICQWALAKLSTTQNNNSTKANDQEPEIDIDVFSQTCINATKTQSPSTSKDINKSNEFPISINNQSPTPKDTNKTEDSPKTLKNNSNAAKINITIDLEMNNQHDKSDTITHNKKSVYNLRSPKKYSESMMQHKRKRINNETQHIIEDNESNKRHSLRKRQSFNYKELVFSRVSLTSLNISPQLKEEKKMSPLRIINMGKNKLKHDPKLLKKCAVSLTRENLDLKLKLLKESSKNALISTSNFIVTQNVRSEKENIHFVSEKSAEIMTPPVVRNGEEHVFKTPLTKTLSKENPKRICVKSPDTNASKLHKTLSVPPKAANKKRKKLSLPAKPMEMWKFINFNKRIDKVLPQSPIIPLTDNSSENGDKKRKKLFSPDNWMQSDGCLKNLSQNQDSFNDGKFCIRFDVPNSDAESDTGIIFG